MRHFSTLLKIVSQYFSIFIGAFLSIFQNSSPDEKLKLETEERNISIRIFHSDDFIFINCPIQKVPSGEEEKWILTIAILTKWTSFLDKNLFYTIYATKIVFPALKAATKDTRNNKINKSHNEVILFLKASFKGIFFMFLSSALQLRTML